MGNLRQVKTIGRADKTEAVVAFAVIKPSYVELFSVRVLSMDTFSLMLASLVCEFRGPP